MRWNDTASTATVNVGALSAVTIFAANPDRIGFSVSLTGGTSTTDCHIRYYPAATDDIPQGAAMLSRTSSANKSLFNQDFQMTPDAIYTGEISAITEAGVIAIVATEY